MQTFRYLFLEYDEISNKSCAIKISELDTETKLVSYTKVTYTLPDTIQKRRDLEN